MEKLTEYVNVFFANLPKNEKNAILKMKLLDQMHTEFAAAQKNGKTENEAFISAIVSVDILEEIKASTSPDELAKAEAEKNYEKIKPLIPIIKKIKKLLTILSHTIGFSFFAPLMFVLLNKISFETKFFEIGFYAILAISFLFLLRFITKLQFQFKNLTDELHIDSNIKNKRIYKSRTIKILRALRILIDAASFFTGIVLIFFNMIKWGFLIIGIGFMLQSMVRALIYSIETGEKE